MKGCIDRVAQIKSKEKKKKYYLKHKLKILKYHQDLNYRRVIQDQVKWRKLRQRDIDLPIEIKSRYITCPQRVELNCIPENCQVCHIKVNKVNDRFLEKVKK